MHDKFIAAVPFIAGTVLCLIFGALGYFVESSLSVTIVVACVLAALLGRFLEITDASTPEELFVAGIVFLGMAAGYFFSSWELVDSAALGIAVGFCLILATLGVPHEVDDATTYQS
jgi:uncharacterized membrane protein YgaE (UPF0421/DUF939 family)